jgi:hypothetical protein
MLQAGGVRQGYATPAASARATWWTACCDASIIIFYCAQHLNGSTEAAEQELRGWALIHNFAPSCPWTVRVTPGLRSPAERLNGKRYHQE